MEKSIVCIDYFGDHKPIVKIVDTKAQVICALIARDGEHLTVHKQKESDNYLFTYYSKTKVHGTWDSTKVELAKRLGYKDLERHGQYIIHDSSPHRNGLHLSSYNLSDDGDIANNVFMPLPLIGLRIGRDDYLQDIPNKYESFPKILLSAKEKEFWLSIFFTSRLYEYEMTDLQPIETSLGYFSFKIESLSEKMHHIATNLGIDSDS